MENPSEKIICLVCNGRTHKIYAIKNGHTVWKCQACRTLFLYPLPKDEESANVYGQDYFVGASKGFGFVDYDADKKAMHNVFARHLDHFESIHGKKGSLFDVGAATGFFMKIAKSKGWQTRGVDISKYAAEEGLKKDLDIIVGTIHDEKSRDERYDIVTMWDVIEHVPTPLLDLKKAHTILKTGGLLAINTPNSGSLYARLLGKHWHLLVPPEHIWYFNQYSLPVLLNKSGFEVLEISCIGKHFSIEYVLSFLYRWQKLSLWKRLLSFVEGKPLGRLSVPINLRDNMFVLARKK